MKIVIDNISPGTSTSSMGKGGMRMYLEYLLSGMIETAPQHEYVLITPDWNKDFNLPQGAPLTKVLLPFVPKGRLLRVLYEQFFYPSLLRRIGGDVFLGLCNSLPPSVGGPAVVVIQSTQFQFVPESYGFLQRNYLQWSVKRAVRKAHAVITVSEHSKQDIVQWTKVSAEKVHAVHHGVQFTASENSGSKTLIQKLKEQYGPFILCVSSFYPYKNLFRLIEAFGLLKSNNSFAHNLVIVGDDTSQVKAEDLASYAQSLGVGPFVKLTGRIDHASIASFYSAADVFVMPSLYETFGLPLLEAMFLGCPVVTSQASCMPEVAGDAAELVSPHDPASIVAGITRILTQPARREELIRRGKERVKAFSWKMSAQKTLKILESVVENKG